MHITFIGTGHGYPEKDRFCSCTVVTVNQKHYVIDAGISLYSILLKNGFMPEEVAAVFITHMHGDHSSGLVEFVDLMSWGKREISTDIFVPTAGLKFAILSLSEAMDHGREIPLSVFREGIVFADANVKVTAFLTQHCVSSYGFLLEAEGKRVYFSGDMKHDISDCPAFVYNEPTDLIVCESAHNCLPSLADRLNAMQTKHIVINHVAPNHSIREFDECLPLMHKPFTLAYDGMKIEI